MASRDFDEFFVTLDLTECLSMQGDAFDALCLVRTVHPPLECNVRAQRHLTRSHRTRI